MNSKLSNESAKLLAALFIGAIIGAAIGVMMITTIKTPEEFKEFCDMINEKFKVHKPKKPIQEMNSDELTNLLAEVIKDEEYEMAAEIKKLIDYKKINP